MKAVTWHGRRDVRVDEIPDPVIEEPTDAIVRITTTAICGSDLHLYEVLGPFIREGMVLGHEPMGIVEEVGSEVSELSPGDRIVLPFQISCGTCWMCDHGLQTQCETTQTREEGRGAMLFGYTKLYGDKDGGQAEYLRVPQAQYTHIKVPEGPPDERFIYLSDVLPTAWQGVEYAGVNEGDTLVVLGLGPIGDMACRVALRKGVRVIGVDLVDERLERVRGLGVEVFDLREHEDDLGDAIREVTDGRGPDAVLEAVGMEAHGSPVAEAVHKASALLPDFVAEKVFKTAGVDRLHAILLAVDIVRRGGTISISGVYGGEADPLPLLTIFDKQLQLRMGQANVKRWVPEILPLLEEGNAFGVEEFHTHRVPLAEAPEAYKTFQEKRDGAIKYLLSP